MTVGDRLTERFIEFCESLPEAERIDGLELTPEQRATKKADFFFTRRRIICEVKTFESDTNAKVVKVLYDAGVRLSDGEYEIHEVLAGRDDRRELYRKCINVMTTAVSDAVDDANRQIRETKRTFGISAADGLLVLLHGRVAILNPDVILKRVSERLKKRTETGAPVHEHLNYVLLLSEVHKLKRLSDGALLAATIAFPNAAVPERFGVGAFCSVLTNGWANWNGRRVWVMSTSELH